MDAVIATLAAIVREDKTALPKHPQLSTFFRGERLLNDNAEALFGLPSARRRVRIMVTLPTEAAHDYEVVHDLLQRGMNCVRLNCAHDTPSDWEAMIAHVRRAEQESGRVCKVLMDLSGPKARTGQVVLTQPKQRLHVGEHILLTRETPTASQQYLVQVKCQLPEVLKYGSTRESLGLRLKRFCPKGCSCV